mmetsp:Transcript_11762/g.34835  ORF Transcript_11762/g.34835 Transcript_11762/m.34835 type:complete len:194 (+) Transcript_11762:71-652(+)
MAEAKAKVIVVGPVNAGKTRLANQIANFESEPNFDTYSPTAGARILEFDREISHAGKRGGSRAVSLAVELWDCSGDKQYEACWPAILANVVGVILVFNPEQPGHDREIGKWYSAFIAKLQLAPSQVLTLAHHKEPPEAFNRTAPPKGLQDFHLVDTALDGAQAVAEMRAAVDDFLTKVGAIALEKHEKELDNL